MTTLKSIKDLENIINTRKFLCLFGIGEQLTDCYNQIVLSVGRTPDFLCDNAQGKWGKEFHGLKCISPSKLREFGNNVTVIITVRKYESIYQQLRYMGIENILLACYDRCYDSIRAIKRIEDDQPELAVRPPSIISLKGKWTLITGASRGVGLQIAVAMAGLGSNIIAHSRSISHVNKLIDACSSLGVKVVPVAAEFSNLVEVEAMLSDLEKLVPQIDIVFNNAAIPAPAGFWSSSGREYLDCYTVNTVVPIRICQALIPQMIQRGFGRIINVSTAVQKRLEVMAYSCSKAALDKFVHDLAPSLHGTGVMISSVNPGWVSTDMTGHDAPHAVESIVPGVLLGAILDCDVNGRWFGAQDYAGLSVQKAVQRALYYMY
jgi:3-oxoacyl-[acyl-carrier protein] reductase